MHLIKFRASVFDLVGHCVCMCTCVNMRAYACVTTSPAHSRAFAHWHLQIQSCKSFRAGRTQGFLFQDIFISGEKQPQRVPELVQDRFWSFPFSLTARWHTPAAAQSVTWTWVRSSELPENPGRLFNICLKCHTALVSTIVNSDCVPQTLSSRNKSKLQ
jgi:hypothetical protein